MRPVNGELVGKLDSKSAKAGDSVIVKTVQSMKTADGTEIPKGSKLLGHVTAVQAHSEASQNSEVAIQFDHVELKGGQSLAVYSIIQSVSPPGSEMAASAPDTNSIPVGISGVDGPMGPMGSAAGPHANSPNSGMTPTTAGVTPGAGQTVSSAGRTVANSPSVGMVVGKAGDVPIRTTAIPNVFLASNASAEASGTKPALSGTLFGAKRDIHLDGGTQVVLEISPAIVR